MASGVGGIFSCFFLFPRGLARGYSVISSLVSDAFAWLRSRCSSPSLAGRVTVLNNDREGGYKYREAHAALRFAVEKYAPDGSDLDVAIHSPDQERWYSDKKEFMRHLQRALREIKEPSSTDIRKTNRVIIDSLREAVRSKYYQANKGRESGPEGRKYNRYCDLVQKLCLVKFAGVCSASTLGELAAGAVRSAGHKWDADVLTEETVADCISKRNRWLREAGPNFKKSVPALTKQKVCGSVGLGFDPGGESNVPYVRSLFGFSIDGEQREATFCRFGTPTTGKVELLSKPQIDPMFLAALDAMKNAGKQFLYVNHQKPTGVEGGRVSVIREIGRTHPNFYFMSIPLDGEIVKLVEAEGTEIGTLKARIAESFMEGKHGCELPRAADIDRETMDGLLNHVHQDWFGGRTDLSVEERKAFWGIFNTVLKHHVMQALKIDFYDSSCKDNKDRGGALGSIDEAVRNVLLAVQGDSASGHRNPERLKALVANALAPYMIKLEHIIDDRLGYLLAVLRHIATLSDKQIAQIKREHPIQILHQEVPQEHIVDPLAAPVERTELPVAVPAG